MHDFLAITVLAGLSVIFSCVLHGLRIGAFPRTNEQLQARDRVKLGVAAVLFLLAWVCWLIHGDVVAPSAPIRVLGYFEVVPEYALQATTVLVIGVAFLLVRLATFSWPDKANG